MSTAFLISLIPCGSNDSTFARTQLSKRPAKYVTAIAPSSRSRIPLCSIDPSTDVGADKKAQVDYDIDSTDSKWAKLTASEFRDRLASKELALCIVGMSNCGKSHWSHLLQTRLSFSLVCVDNHIEGQLDKVLKADGHVGIEGLAEWMGFPSDKRFKANQATYLAAEERITSNVSPASGKNCVVDTTGSVVYLSRRARKGLVQKYLTVHLEAEDHMLSLMTDNYFKTPKPVVWGNAYQPLPGESPDKAMRRCYPNLLRERRKRYSGMAHVTVPASVCLDRSLTVDGFLNEICTRLPSA